MELDHVRIRGAREHNLKSVDVRIPKKSLVVLSGVSGSGKSSLAFDTLYAEGQRRYVESLSAYARQFLGRLDKPRYDSIRGLSPTISIEQKTAGSNPRSTVGTITEIADYLRVLFARVGVQHCLECGQPVSGQSAQQIAQTLGALDPGTRVHLLVPLLANRKGEHRELLAEARRDGIVRLRIDGEIRASEEVEALDKRRKHNVEAVLDRIVIGKATLARITESVEKALERGDGELIAALDDGDRIFSSKRACCGRSYPELTPQAFSFNNPQGMCPDCNGLGTRVAMDPARIVPNTSKTIDEGAIVPWGEGISKKNTGWENGTRLQILKQLGIPLNKPWNKLTAKQRDLVLWGTGEKRYAVRWEGENSQGTLNMRWEGVIPRMMRRFSESKSERAKTYYQGFVGNAECPTCRGTRLRRESAAVRVAGRSLTELGRLTVRDCREFFEGLQLEGSARHIAGEVLKEVQSRLGFLDRVGLGYLSLDRAGPSLSGGEAQRIRLASQVGSELTGVIYVLDEPSIGLHQRDNDRLIATLVQMRDIGNTVVVVEHDQDTILAADYVIDFGPGAGAAGGRVVHAGTPQSLLRSKESLTGAYLSGRRRIEVPTRRRSPKGHLVIRGASENNLRGIDVSIPLGVLTTVTGVSGAGKSTLINDILYPALAKALHNASAPVGRHERIEGIDAIDKIIDIDQKPIGRTPRSNPATYIKAFDEIRKLFAELPDARARGYSPGRFSFNVKGGRCETCEGDGVRKIEMHFLADVFVTCEECDGRRFNDATLDVKYKGKSIADVLELTVDEAVELFAAHPSIAAPLALLQEVGVGYLHLGQPSPTLSGGEAQRIKLARELAKRDTGDTLYLLDEPTTGLHFEDVRKLLGVLERLVEAGNTVVVIEHNLDVIKTADHVIDLGPEGGPDGGLLVAEGTPEDIAAHPSSFTGKYLAPLLAPPRSQGRYRATSKATSSSRTGAKSRSALST
ncbi:MAG: excinuclease ABC subunit UvrA [Myxococcales bacterium]|jgi:excinuclease ABC subunit A|nr:excinuclease ABC subunit UvrA [Myxococcales bacterium]